MDAGGSYGPDKQIDAANWITFFKRPQVILRIIAWVLALLTFFIIAGGCWFEDSCVFDQSNGVCRFASFLSAVAFIDCIAFVVIDLLVDGWSNFKRRRYAMLTDLALSGLLALLWAICLVVLTATWSSTEDKWFDSTDRGETGPQAVIGLAFFSIVVWVGLTYFAFIRFRQGIATSFAPPGVDPNAPPPAAGVNAWGSNTANMQGYQPPTY